MFASHMVTYGATQEAVVGTAGGGAFFSRRRRWMALMLSLVALWL